MSPTIEPVCWSEVSGTGKSPLALERCFQGGFAIVSPQPGEESPEACCPRPAARPATPPELRAAAHAIKSRLDIIKTLLKENWEYRAMRASNF
jgi:hypothetical protein